MAVRFDPSNPAQATFVNITVHSWIPHDVKAVQTNMGYGSQDVADELSGPCVTGTVGLRLLAANKAARQV